LISCFPSPDACYQRSRLAKNLLDFLLSFARSLTLPDCLAKNLLDFLLFFARSLTLPACLAKNLLDFLFSFARSLALPDRLAKNLLDFLLSFATGLAPGRYLSPAVLPVPAMPAGLPACYQRSCLAKKKSSVQ